HLRGQRIVSPDATRVIGVDDAARWQVCQLPATGIAACAPLPGVSPQDDVAGWAADGRGVFVYRRDPVPVKIERVDVGSGKREPAGEARPAQAAVSGLTR